MFAALEELVQEGKYDMAARTFASVRKGEGMGPPKGLDRKRKGGEMGPLKGLDKVMNR